jgi:hypothetical protein
MPSTKQYIEWLQSGECREPDRSQHRLLAARLLADKCLPMHEYNSRSQLLGALLFHLRRRHESPTFVYKLLRVSFKRFR